MLCIRGNARHLVLSLWRTIAHLEIDGKLRGYVSQPSEGCWAVVRTGALRFRTKEQIDRRKIRSALPQLTGQVHTRGPGQHEERSTETEYARCKLVLWRVAERNAYPPAQISTESDLVHRPEVLPHR